MGCVSVRAKGAKANGLILAIDVDECKSVIRVYEPSGLLWHTASFSTIIHCVTRPLFARVSRSVKASQDANPPPKRPRSIRKVRVATLVVVGGFLCWVTFLVEQRLMSPTATPAARDVTFDVVVFDANTNIAVSSAEVGIDEETGQYDAPGATWKGTTNSSGLLRLVHRFGANTVLDKDGKVRGRVVFNQRTSIQSFSYRLVVKAPGYREEWINLGERYSGGIDYEDPYPRTIQVLLSPSTPR
jgi:hypothetical protein